MPARRKGEKKSKYISRCMSHDEMKRKFPKQKQRVAVCYSYAEDEEDTPRPKQKVYLSRSKSGKPGLFTKGSMAMPLSAEEATPEKARGVANKHGFEYVEERAVSKAQQQAAAIALHGEPKGKGAAAEMAKSMSKEELHKFASTKRKGLPKHKKKKVKESEDHLPDPFRMARVLVAQFDKKIPRSVRRSPEPYRAMMYHLGFEQFDGTPWWNAVMDATNEVNAMAESAWGFDVDMTLDQLEQELDYLYREHEEATLAGDIDVLDDVEVEIEQLEELIHQKKSMQAGDSEDEGWSDRIKTGVKKFIKRGRAINRASDEIDKTFRYTMAGEHKKARKHFRNWDRLNKVLDPAPARESVNVAEDFKSMRFRDFLYYDYLSEQASGANVQQMQKLVQQLAVLVKKDPELGKAIPTTKRRQSGQQQRQKVVPQAPNTPLPKISPEFAVGEGILGGVVSGVANALSSAGARAGARASNAQQFIGAISNLTGAVQRGYQEHRKQQPVPQAALLAHQIRRVAIELGQDGWKALDQMIRSIPDKDVATRMRNLLLGAKQ